jgi:hypothetical protein
LKFRASLAFTDPQHSPEPTALAEEQVESHLPADRANKRGFLLPMS